MKIRSKKNAVSRRDSRIKRFEVTVGDKRGFKRPGSLNPKKGS